MIRNYVNYILLFTIYAIINVHTLMSTPWVVYLCGAILYELFYHVDQKQWILISWLLFRSQLIMIHCIFKKDIEFCKKYMHRALLSLRMADSRIVVR